MPRLRTFAAATTLAAASVSLVSVASPSEASATTTHYSFHANGWATRVRGGDLPANSGDLGYQSTSCTRIAGRDKVNRTAGATLPGIGKIGATVTRTRTIKSGHRLEARTVHKVASITLAQSALGSLSIVGIESIARAYHNSTGFHAAGDTSIGKIQLKTPLGTQTFPIPSPKRDLTIPGVATISLGKVSHSRGAHGARSSVAGLHIKVAATDTTIDVARAKAKIADGAPSGVFTGFSDAIDASALGGVGSVGRNPLIHVPCSGSHGKLRSKSLAGLPLGNATQGLVSVSGLTSSNRSDQDKTSMGGYSRATVAKVSLGGGQIVVKGLRAQANVKWRKGHGFHVNKRGTTFASVQIAGQSVPVSQLRDALNKVDIPGLAKIQTGYVLHRGKNKIEVVALRLTLLDATDQSKTVVNIGHARFAVHRHS